MMLGATIAEIFAFEMLASLSTDGLGAKSKKIMKKEIYKTIGRLICINIAIHSIGDANVAL